MKFESYTVKEKKFNNTTKPHNLPIYATSSFNFENIEEGIDIFKGAKSGHVYSRYGNPTIETVASKIAELESYNLNLDSYGIMVSSGMSAISTLLFATLKPGDVLLTQANLYGGTTELLKLFSKKIGIEIVFTDLTNPSTLEEILKTKSIQMLYCESPANPSLACVDLAKISSFAKKYEFISVIDNTFCTPYLQKPLEFGFDFSIHSTTKYLNGHGNSIAGVIVGRDKSSYEDVLKSMKLLGTNCNGFDAWLVNNGLKTLSIRMQKHSENALELAERLNNHEKIKQVNYPFLPSNPQVEMAKSQMLYGGGMLSFELVGGINAGIHLMNNVKMCLLAPTLGDVDTLILHPATMSHRNIDRQTRLKNGITDGLIRMSVGIEDVEDLYSDITQAMDKL